MQVKIQRRRDWRRRAAGKPTSKSTRVFVPRLRAFALWQAGSSQQFPMGTLACIDVGSAGLTGGQRRSKMEEASDCREVARFTKACSQILPATEASAPHSTKTHARPARRWLNSPLLFNGALPRIIDRAEHHISCG